MKITIAEFLQKTDIKLKIKEMKKKNTAEKEKREMNKKRFLELNKKMLRVKRNSQPTKYDLFTIIVSNLDINELTYQDKVNIAEELSTTYNNIARFIRIRQSKLEKS